MKRSKAIALFAVLNLVRMTANACDGCSIRQPRILRGLSHGTGPDTQWDYCIVAIVASLVVLTLFFSVKWLVNPGERSEAHIKNLILIKDEWKTGATY